MSAAASRSLLALSTSALALPGVGLADAPPTESTLSYQFSNYREDDLSRSTVVFGDPGRYDIDVHQFQLIAPIGRNSALQIAGNYEALSGASPWYTTRGVDGEPIVIMSGASGIEDRRGELSIGGSYYLENGSLSGNVGYSEEDDYRATYFGLSGERHYNNDLTTIRLGFSVSSDEIFPTDASLFNRVTDEDKRSISSVISVSQIINRVATFQTALSITETSGFLSDPYKLRDVRPDDKTQIAWASAYRHFFIDADAALHVNYRYYHDDFGINSHTVDMAWHQNLSNGFKLVPILRYYSQSAADFYTNTDDFLNPQTNYQSSDYRLSAFGAVSGGLSVVAEFGDWTATLTTERYVANEKYALHNVREPSTALIQYFRSSVGIQFSF